MRSAKKNKNEPFSLFSFQDIITCVTGIMLFIVLLVTLQLVVKKVEVISSSKADKGQVEHLRQKLAQMITEKKKIEQWLERSHVEIMKLLEVTPNELPKKMDKLTQHNSYLVKRIRPLEEECRNLQREIEVKEAALEEDKHNLAQLEKRSAKLLTQRTRQDEKVKELKGQIAKKKERESNLVDLSVSRRDDKAPIIVQCSDAKIKVKTRGGKIRVFKTSGQHLSPMITQLMNFLKTRSSSREYLAVLLKPSAAGYFGRLHIMATLFSFDVGFEPFPEKSEAKF